MWVGGLFDIAQFGHQAFVNAKTASRIQNQNIIGLQFCGLQSAFGNLRWAFAINLVQHANLGLITKHTQLLARGRTRHVKRGQHDLFAVTAAQPQSQFTCSCGFTRTLQTRHQNNGWRVGGNIQWCGITTKHFNQSVMDNFDHLLIGAHGAHAGNANRLFTHFFGKGLYRRQGDISIKQSQPHFTKRRINIRLAKRASACQPLKDIS